MQLVAWRSCTRHVAETHVRVEPNLACAGVEATQTQHANNPQNNCCSTQHQLSQPSQLGKQVDHVADTFM